MFNWRPLRKRRADAADPAAPAAVTATPSPAAPTAAREVRREAATGTASNAVSNAGRIDAPTDAAIAAPSPELNIVVLQRQWSAQVLGAGGLSDTPPSAAEQAALDRLAQVAQQPLQVSLMPRLPAVVPQLMARLRRDDSSPRELADLIARDPSLVGEVVRLANSVRYRPPRPIADLHGAVQALGLLGLAQLVTRVAMRPLFQLAQGRFGSVAGRQLWELADRCAQAGALLRAGRADAFAAYLSGISAHVGLIAAVRVLDQAYPAGQPAPSSIHFHDALWLHAARLSARIAREWAFPDDVLGVLSQRTGQAGAHGTDALSLALWAADVAAKRTMLGAAPAETLHADVARAEAALARSFGGDTTR